MEPDVTPAVAPGPPRLSQKQAAEACGVSEATIRRRRAAGKLPNAVEDGNGGFLIPVTDLIAAGLMDRVTVTPSRTQSDTDLPSRVTQLEHELELERQRRIAAEAIAEERGKRADLAELTLKALTSSTAAPPEATTEGRHLGHDENAGRRWPWQRR